MRYDKWFALALLAALLSMVFGVGCSSPSRKDLTPTRLRVVRIYSNDGQFFGAKIQTDLKTGVFKVYTPALPGIEGAESEDLKKDAEGNFYLSPEQIQRYLVLTNSVYADNPWTPFYSEEQWGSIGGGLPESFRGVVPVPTAGGAAYLLIDAVPEGDLRNFLIKLYHLDGLVSEKPSEKSAIKLPPPVAPTPAVSETKKKEESGSKAPTLYNE